MKIEKAIDLCKKQVSCFETDCMVECLGCPNESSPDDFKDALQLIIIPVLQEKQEREHPAVLSLEELRQMDGEPVWWWNTTDKPRLTICNSAPYIPDVMFISFDWAKEDSTSITPYKKIIKWGYKPYARKPEQEEK